MDEANDILSRIAAVRHLMRRNFDEPDECKMSLEAYSALKAASGQAEVIASPIDIPRTVFGLKVVVDDSLAPGEWKLVSPRDRAETASATYSPPHA